MTFLDSDWRMVSRLLNEHGDAASGVAMQRALHARAAQDRAGEAMWLRVFDAIEEHQSTAHDPSTHQPN